jgi:hypothetical protein
MISDKLTLGILAVVVLLLVSVVLGFGIAALLRGCEEREASSGAGIDRS